MKYTKKPVEIEAFTFEEFVEYAKENTPEPHWSIDFRGHSITHENDSLYLIPTLEGVHNFTPEDMLIVDVKGEIYPCKKDIFAVTYTNQKSDGGELGLAKRLYDKYCDAVGGVAFNGDPLPKSDEFFDDESKKKQSNAWLACSKETYDILLEAIKNLGHPAYNQSSSTTDAIDQLREKGFLYLGIK